MSSLISYAQNFEDVILWRALGHIEAGCYIDIGAQSPDTDSVSRVFYEHGWRGVHVEPASYYANQLRERRPDEVVLQAAIAKEPGALRFFEIADTGLSTLDEIIAREHEVAGFGVRETVVPAITLDSLLQHVGDRPIHWMKIDVEGAELSVIEGWLSSQQRPWVLVIESTVPLSPKQVHQQWEPLVLEKGYKFAYFDGLNRFYVSEAHPELMDVINCGPNIFDGFSLSSHSLFSAATNLSYQALEIHAETQIAALNECVRVHVEHGDSLQLKIDEVQATLDRIGLELDQGQMTLEEERAAFALAEIEHAKVVYSMADAKSAAEAEHARIINDMADAKSAAEAEHARIINNMAEAQNAAEAEHARAIGAMFETQNLILSERQKMAEEAVQAKQANLITLQRMEQARAYLQEELDAAYARTDEIAQSAHRWWITAEEFRAHITALEGSRSWRWTSPLRCIRRWIQRLDCRMRLTVKKILRPMAVGGIGYVIARPSLRTRFKPFLAQYPIINSRLKAIARHEGLLDLGDSPRF